MEILEDQVGARREELSTTSAVFEQLLEDVQQRLVYKAQKFIQSDIGGYSHSPGDLAYPDKLIVAVSNVCFKPVLTVDERVRVTYMYLYAYLYRKS